jgi:hypothetical protein
VIVGLLALAAVGIAAGVIAYRTSQDREGGAGVAAPTLLPSPSPQAPEALATSAPPLAEQPAASAAQPAASVAQPGATTPSQGSSVAVQPSSSPETLSGTGQALASGPTTAKTGGGTTLAGIVFLLLGAMLYTVPWLARRLTGILERERP